MTGNNRRCFLPPWARSWRWNCSRWFNTVGLKLRCLAYSRRTSALNALAACTVCSRQNLMSTSFDVLRQVKFVEDTHQAHGVGTKLFFNMNVKVSTSNKRNTCSIWITRSFDDWLYQCFEVSYERSRWWAWRIVDENVSYTCLTVSTPIRSKYDIGYHIIVHDKLNLS